MITTSMRANKTRIAFLLFISRLGVVRPAVKIKLLIIRPINKNHCPHLMGNKYKVNKLGVVMMFLVFICLFLLTLNYTILSLETTEAGSKLHHYVCVCLRVCTVNCLFFSLYLSVLSTW